MGFVYAPTARVLEMSGSQELDPSVVLQKPDDVRVRIPVFHTETACPGAVTAFLLRRIAYRAGAYAPGIQEVLFHDLTTHRSGAWLTKVQGWMQAQTHSFHRLGYRLYFKWCAEKTEALGAWVRDGRGYRGATLATRYDILHPNGSAPSSIEHAVGLAVDRLPGRTEDELVMIDPWPGTGAPDTVPVAPNLDVARRDKRFNALMFFWVGWS
jgi:hypothetical protein